MTCTVITTQQVTGRALGSPRVGACEIALIMAFHFRSGPDLLAFAWLLVIIECGGQRIGRTNLIKGKDKRMIGAEIKLKVVNIDKERQDKCSVTDSFLCGQQFVFVLVHLDLTYCISAETLLRRAALLYCSV